MTDKRPTDAEILQAVGVWGNSSMTYVIANRLRSKGFKVRTDWVLRQMKRLENAGAVSRVRSNYAVQLCWSVNQLAGAAS